MSEEALVGYFFLNNYIIKAAPKANMYGIYGMFTLSSEFGFIPILNATHEVLNVSFRGSLEKQ